MILLLVDVRLTLVLLQILKCLAVVLENLLSLSTFVLEFLLFHPFLVLIVQYFVAIGIWLVFVRLKYRLQRI